MRIKLMVILIVLIVILFIANQINSTNIEFEQVTEYGIDIDIIGVKNYVLMYPEEPNVYLFINQSGLILYSNLRMSEFDSYYISDVKQKGGKLYIDIKGNRNINANDKMKELIAKIYIEEEPEKIEVIFLGKKIKEYKIIRG